MKFFILLFLFYQQIFASEQTLKGYERRIAVLYKPNFRGEFSFAYRIKAACENLCWKADIVDLNQTDHLEKNNYDFVIKLCPGSYKHSKCKNYIAIFHPLHHYFRRDGLLKKKYRHYDGYLLTYSPGASDKNFNSHKLPYIKWYPTAQRLEYKEVDPAYLFYFGCVWGNRFQDEKYRQLLGLLDNESYMHCYGSLVFQDFFPKSYQSSIPYDRDSLYEIATKDGISLVLHSCDHNAHGLPSGRIFEAAAASTVIICDENPFVKEHFKDSVLYINMNEDALSIFKQIQDHMNWIQSNKTKALEKAKMAHEIYEKQFLLEDQLLQLGKLHDQLSEGSFSKWKKKIRALFSLKRNTISPLINPKPLMILPNIDHQYSLINSVDFHPKKNLFCVTYTHNNKICLYEIDANHKPRIFQNLHNPIAQLSEPQHAVFSPDGEKMVVANWTNQTFAIYQCEKNGFFCEKPVVVIPSPENFRKCKPHGIAFSPCGNYFAVAYGAANYYEHGIALFKNKGVDFECISFLKNSTLPGIPKGIAFSPDGTCLLVTFCEANSLAIFNIENQNIKPIPKQTIQGLKNHISRPEDIKVSSNGHYCAVTNSDQHTVIFYPFDQESNSILQNISCFVLKNPKAKLCFPHGIAFSPDGLYLVLTQFGPIHMTKDGDISWSKKMKSSEGKISLYLLDKNFEL